MTSRSRWFAKATELRADRRDCPVGGRAVLVVAEQKRPSQRRRRGLEDSSLAGSPRTAPTSTTSAYSLARPAWSEFRFATSDAGRLSDPLLHVRRYDMDLVPTPDLMLEFGDRVGVLTPPDRREEIRKHFGDTVKRRGIQLRLARVGMVLGVLLGLIPIPIPGVGTVTLGIGGGPLIVALILGKLRRTGPMLWTMPLPAKSCCATSVWRFSWLRSASTPVSRS